MGVGAASVLFFLILEANSALSIVGLNKPSANTSADLARVTGFFEEETKLE